MSNLPTTASQDASFLSAANVWVKLANPTAAQTKTFKTALTTWLAAANPPASLPKPFVRTAVFTVPVGYGLDALIGAVMTDIPATSYVITGDPNGYFAIYPSGNLRTSVTVVVPPGTYSIMIAGVNANGTGPAAAISVVLQSAVNPPPPSPPPPLTGFPDATNTGWKPTGVTLTPSSGDLTLGVAGTVADSLDINGVVWISANNCTLKRSRITSPSFYIIRIVDGVVGTMIEDCEINGVGTGNDGCYGIYGFGTFLRNNIYNVENGIGFWGDTNSSALIQDNYIHDLQASGSPHYDPISIDGQNANIDIEHNTLINPATAGAGGVMIDNYAGPVSNITVNNNRMIGGGYTIYVDGHFNSNPITGVTITNNRMGKGYWGYNDFTGNNQSFSGNVDDSTGLPVTSGQ